MVNKLREAIGQFEVALGLLFLRSGLERQGKKFEIVTRMDIKRIFLEGFKMGRDTRSMTPEKESQWYETHGLYHPEEAWVNSDAEEFIDPDPFERIVESWPKVEGHVATGVIQTDKIKAGTVEGIIK